MRVMCINDNWNPCPSLPKMEFPKFGDIDTVIRHEQNCYGLERYGWTIAFDETYFIPLSDGLTSEIQEREVDSEPVPLAL